MPTIVRAVIGIVAAIAVLVAPRVAAAQTKPISIDPGMTKEQVLARLGNPSEESHSGSFTYLLYNSDCGAKCRQDDLVVLERGVVTDAVFQSGKRTYTGQSEQPSALQPASPMTTRVVPAPIRASTPGSASCNTAKPCRSGTMRWC